MYNLVLTEALTYFLTSMKSSCVVESVRNQVKLLKRFSYLTWLDIENTEHLQILGLNNGLVVAKALLFSLRGVQS